MIDTMIGVAGFALVPLVSAFAPTLAFNVTLSPMDAVVKLEQGTSTPWNTTFFDHPWSSYVNGMAGTGPVRAYANSSTGWEVGDRPVVRFSYVGTEFYILGSWTQTGTKFEERQPPMNLWWSDALRGGTVPPAPTPEGDNLLADSLIFFSPDIISSDTNTTALNSAGNASAYTAIDPDNLNLAQGRVNSHQVSFGVNPSATRYGLEFGLSRVIVTAVMESEAETIDDVPVNTVPFVLDGRLNPAFNYTGDTFIGNYIGDVAGHEPVKHSFVQWHASGGTSGGTIAVPRGTGYVVVRGVRGQNYLGSAEFSWVPVPPLQFSQSDSSVNMNSTWEYPDSIMHMMALDPANTYTLKFRVSNRVAMSSVSFYSSFQNGTRSEPTNPISSDSPSGSPSGSSDTPMSGNKLSAGAIAGIAVGAVVGVILISICAFFAGRKHFQRQKHNVHPDSASFEVDEKGATPTPFVQSLPREPAQPVVAAHSPTEKLNTPRDAWVTTGFTPTPSEADGAIKPLTTDISGTTATPSYSGQPPHGHHDLPVHHDLPGPSGSKATVDAGYDVPSFSGPSAARDWDVMQVGDRQWTITAGDASK